jgi:hypothetical protein
VFLLPPYSHPTPILRLSCSHPAPGKRPKTRENGRIIGDSRDEQNAKKKSLSGTAGYAPEVKKPEARRRMKVNDRKMVDGNMSNRNMY